LTSLKILVSYFVTSAVSLPFLSALWLGEVPILVAPQIPKIAIASWLRRGVVMPLIRYLGLSSGSFSPDYETARPYALALAYILPVLAVLATARAHTRKDGRYRFWSCLLLCAAVLDYVLTLRLGVTPGLTLY